jgi:glyoxylase-like metal-dependent hydrolase (beta-lactamase superfamily II)
MGSDFETGITEFKTKLDRGEVEFVLDLRLESEFESWRIEGSNDFEIINIPQLDFVGEEEKYLDRLPKDKLIYIVCAHGDASKYSAEVLSDKGFKAKGLAGGMDSWSVLYDTTRLAGADPVIYQIYRLAKGCMSGVIISDGEAVVIDAVRHLEQIKAVIDKHKAKIKYVFDTHLQADHISGGLELARFAGCDYCINPVDAVGATYEFIDLEDGAEFKFGQCRITAIHSPGHTPGSTSLLLNEKSLFVGDTIMKTTAGRPDLGGMVEAWAELLYHTIHRTFSKYSDDTVILPSHAASVRERDENGMVCFPLGKARKELKLFAIKDPGEFLDYVKSTLHENPARYQDIRQVNLGLLPADEDKMRELEIGMNLCGMASKQC